VPSCCVLGGGAGVGEINHDSGSLLGIGRSELFCAFHCFLYFSCQYYCGYCSLHLLFC